jgi:hypothetical protein
MRVAFSCLALAIAGRSIAVADDADNASPVKKVLKLLKDMQGQLKAEKEHEEEVYAKLSCWCEVNGKEKDAAVEAAMRKTAELESTINALTAKATDVEGSIKSLKEETAANQESLKAATELREKERAEFNAEDKELLLSVDSIKNALVILSRHQSFLQVSSGFPTAFLEAKKAVKKLLDDHDDLLNQILNPNDKELVQQFVQAGGTEAIKTKNMGEIVGILKQMKETFESNMSKATADENKAEETFAQLKSAKTEEIQSGLDLISSKEQLLAKTNSKKAEAKEDLNDTTAALTADQAFLVDLNKRCSVSDAEWQERQKTRSAEISAVSEAIAIIAGDDAHDTFGRTFSFVQVAKSESRKDKARREKARAILLRQAKKDASASLLAVASAVELDAFSRVTDMVNKMIADLEQEQKDEKEHKDYCEAELHTNEMENMENDNLMKDLQAQLGDLTAQIDTFTDEIAQLKASITEMYIQMQRGSENRQAENKEFQTTVADQRATQVILLKALDRLNVFYDQQALLQTKGKQPSLLQAHAKQQGPPPPPGLSEYKSNDGAGSVLTMLKEVIQDAKNMEKTAIKDEQDANDGYAAFVTQTYEAVAAAQSSIVDKQEAKAEAEKAKIGKAEDLEAATAEAETLNNVLAQLHSSCDFVMQNFDLRQEARVNEITSLQETLAALKTDDPSF